MKVRECIEAAGVYLDLRDRAREEDDFLFACAKLVLGEIAADHFPVKHVSVLELDGQPILLKEIHMRIHRIYKLTGRWGEVRFKVLEGKLYCAEKGVFEVEYSVLPAYATQEDEADLSAAVTPHTAALGIAAEFCLIRGMYEKSAMFQERFLTQLRLAETERRSAYIKYREWI